MKQLILFILLTITVLLRSEAQSNKGILRGSIQNTKKELLEGVSVHLGSTGQGAVTNDDGLYEIKNIAPGNYTLVISGIGYKISKENVVIKSGEVTILDLQLNETTLQLEPVTVKGTRKDKYVIITSTSGTRMPLDLVETPQSIQVISQQLIQDQKAQTLNDLTKNMVGVINNNTYSSFTMRGFSSIEATFSNNFITYDGILGNMYYWQQSPFLYNIDRVENIGGPAAALYSVGTPGGVINMVTKKPLDHPYYSFSITTGSWGLIDASADMGGALTKNGKLRYRLNIGANNQNSVFKYQYTNNIVLAPSLSYQFSDRTNITVDYVRNDYHTREFEFWGGAILMKPDSTYDWKHILRTTAFYSPADFAVTHNNSLSLTFNHGFSENFKLSFVSRYTHAYLNTAGISGTYFSGTNYFSAYPDSVPRQYVLWTDRSYNFINSLFTTETFGNDKFKQTFVTGIDLQFYGGKDYYAQGIAPTISFANPDYNNDILSRYPDSTAFIQNNKNTTVQFAPYIQDLISIGTHVKLLIAGRYETYNWISRPNGKDNYTQDNDSSTAHVFLPRGGFVYSFNKNQSVYASYCESYQPQYDNMRNNGGPFPPQIGQQEEIGYKGVWFNGKLLSTLAVYNIFWKNQLAADPSDSTHQRLITIPGLYSRGAELTLQANLNQWSIQGSYAYNNEIFSENSPLGNKGDRFDNAPHSIANLWLKYNVANHSVLKRLSFLLGGKYVSNRIGSTLSAPKFLMPAYFVLDAGINYNYKRFDFSLNAYNITNTVYIPGWYASDFMVMPGTPFNWKLTIRYTIK